jgi:sigma-B regulation protein RsbU (phosphoserine phosphatase)
MIPFSKTIGFRLLLVSFFLLALPILVDSFILVYKRHQGDIAEAKTSLKESVFLRKLPLSKVQPIREGVMDSLFLFLNLNNGLPQPSAELNQQLGELAKEVKLEDIVLLKKDNDALIPVAYGQAESKKVDYFSLFKNPDLFGANAIDRGFAQYLIYTLPDKTPKFMIAKGLVNNVGDPLGAIVVFDDASKLLQDIIRPDITNIPIEFLITSSSSIILASSDPKIQFHYFNKIDAADQKKFKDLFPNHPVELKESLTTKDTGNQFWEFHWRGKKQLATQTKIPGTSYNLIAYALFDDVYKHPLEAFAWIYLSYFLILIAGTIVIYFITKRLMRPVQQLCSVMLKVKDGDLKARYKKERFGMEINRLGQQFNEMMQLLLNKQESVVKERFQKEKNAAQLQMGHDLQLSLLDIESAIPQEIDLSFNYLPAKDVGGDFYDYIKRSDGDIILTIADASGKGLNACCYSLMLKSILRTLSVNESMLGAVMRKGNNLFIRDTGISGMFVTVQMVWMNPTTGDFTHFSFGHNPGFIISSDGGHRSLKQTEMAMGVLEKEERINALNDQLQPDEVLVMYSDGVSEAHNKEKKLFEMDRLIQAATEHRSESADKIAKGILRTLEKFVDGADQHDDITLIVMKKRGV